MEDKLRVKLGYELERHSKKTKQKIWKNLSETLLSSRKNRPAVNVAVIARNSKAGSRVVVPGKVLGAGTISHGVTVAAYSFSQSARTKIMSSGGKCLGLGEFMRSTADAKDVVILG
jgi:large subunit ribosomal protein L18e